MMTGIDKRMEQNQPMKKCVSKKFLDYCDFKYPALINRKDFRRMFMYLAFGTYVDKFNEQKNDGALVLSYQKLAEIAERKTEAQQRNFKAIMFLNEFKKLVLPGFVWNEAEQPKDGTWLGKCRTVKHSGLDAADSEFIQNEYGWEGEKYYFDSGVKFTNVVKAANRKTELEQYLEEMETFQLNSTQKKILNGMKVVSLNGRAFTKKLYDNKEEILQSIKDLTPKDTDKITIEEKREMQLKILESIKEDGRVFYRPTPLGRTPRLHATNECVLTLKSPVRKAFCKGWIEADLVSSQFVILAALLDAPISKAFIKSEQNLWKYLNEASGGIGKPQGKDKEPFKTLIYGICFGLSKTEALAKLKNAGKESLITNPMVEELFNRRQKWFDHIKHMGYVTDIWGNKHPLENAGRREDIYGNYVFAKERWEGALAATKIQSIEMEIISSIFDCQEKYGENYFFNVTLFQHDGFTFSAGKKQCIEVIQSRLNTYVQNKAMQVGEKLDLDLSAVKLEFNQL